MKTWLHALFITLVTAGLAGGVWQSWQRERLFAQHGVAQTLTVSEAEPARIDSLFPPRMAYAYSGRIGNVDARIETARRLVPGQTVAIRHLTVDTQVPLALLGGRTDRVVSKRSAGGAVWFAYGSPDASFVANLAADTPLPAALTMLVCGLTLLASLIASIVKPGVLRPPLRDLRHPILRPPAAPEPTPGPASTRVQMPERPPPLPEPAASEPEANLTLPRRTPPPPPRG